MPDFNQYQTSSVKIRRITSSGESMGSDSLVVEEPLEIRLSYVSGNVRLSSNVAITMRTPGADEDLATGFLFSEGIITHRKEILELRPVKVRSTMASGNVIEVVLQEEVKPDLNRLKRHFYTSSSCGVCGKASLEAVRTLASFDLKSTKTAIKKDILFALPETLRNQQNIFSETGGLHASAIFDMEGNLKLLKEDVGRHNALDKVIGAMLKKGNLPLSDNVLLVSGRASFELVQKAWMAGIPVFAAVGAPSSLAVQLAEEAGMTMIGFLRDGRANIYTGKEGIQA